MKTMPPIMIAVVDIFALLLLFTLFYDIFIRLWQENILTAC